MRATQLREPLIYLAVLLLCLIILTLVAISPADFLNISAVYQGF